MARLYAARAADNLPPAARGPPPGRSRLTAALATSERPAMSWMRDRLYDGMGRGLMSAHQIGCLIYQLLTLRAYNAPHPARSCEVARAQAPYKIQKGQKCLLTFIMTNIPYSNQTWPRLTLNSPRMINWLSQPRQQPGFSEFRSRISTLSTEVASSDLCRCVWGGLFDGPGKN